VSPIVGRRRARADVTENPDVVEALTRAAAAALTGVVEVSDRTHKAEARIYLYEGGVYAVDLDGYLAPVATRLDAAGRFDGLRPDDRAVLAALPDPDATAGAVAVERGWLPADALAQVHQEFVLACAGAALNLPRARTRVRAGETTDRVCTLPLPVASLIETVRLRTRRLEDTWAMIDTGHGPGRGVLRRTDVPLQGAFSIGEVGHLAAELDGERPLDDAAAVLGLTRAEAVYLASLLLNAGIAAVQPDAEPSPATGPLLVPEEFGARSAARLPAQDRRAAAPPAPTIPPAEPPALVPTDLRVAPAVAPPSAPVPVDPISVARAEVSRCQDELLAHIRDEHEAVARTAEASRRLEDAKARLVALENAE
jgi:hypothetical protein